LREQQLIKKAQGGDAEAYCDLCEIHEDRLLYQARHFCRDTAMAEELVQETLIQAWKSLSNFNGSCQYSTWLIAIMFRRHKTLLKQRSGWLSIFRSHVGEIDSVEIEAKQNDPQGELLKQEESEVLNHLIKRLPIHQREVILLRFFEGASLESIAQALNCSVGTIKSRLHYALKKLREYKSLSLPLSSES
jgi:RNA polymerase sigma-70 factor, ECF subfamily